MKFSSDDLIVFNDLAIRNVVTGTFSGPHSTVTIEEIEADIRIDPAGGDPRIVCIQGRVQLLPDEIEAIKTVLDRVAARLTAEDSEVYQLQSVYSVR